MPVDRGLWGSYFSGLALTLSNPMTILSFAAVFASAGVGAEDSGRLAAVWVLLGTFSGSTAWWLILAAATERLRDRLDLRLMRWLNRLSGLALMLFGLSALSRML